MIVWSLVSQKGGSGKSTLAIHLALEAAIRGAKTLLLDVDPQASSSRWGDRRKGGAVDVDVASEHTARLDGALEAAQREGYQMVVIDTAPHADASAVTAARAARRVLVPCRPSILDLDAIGLTLNLMTIAKCEAMVVLNAAPIRSRVVDQARRAVEKQGHKVSGVVIHERVAFRHALTDGRVAREYEATGAAADEISGLFDMLSGLDDDMIAWKHDREIA
jgi:chromosome partitioning protein